MSRYFVFVNGILGDDEDLSSTVKTYFGHEAVHVKNPTMSMQSATRAHPILLFFGVIGAFFAVASETDTRRQKLFSGPRKILEEHTQSVAKTVIEKIRQLKADDGTRRITILGHSHGGMVVKEVLAIDKETLIEDAIVFGCPVDVPGARAFRNEEDLICRLSDFEVRDGDVTFQEHQDDLVRAHELMTYFEEYRKTIASATADAANSPASADDDSEDVITVALDIERHGDRDRNSVPPPASPAAPTVLGSQRSRPPPVGGVVP